MSTPVEGLLSGWSLAQLGPVQSGVIGYDSRLWDEFRGYVWPELAGYEALCATLEQLGRVRCPLPVQAGLVQVDAALAALEEAGAHHRRQLLTGSRRYALALHDRSGRVAPNHVSVTAGQDADGRWYLSGTARHVTYGDSVDLLLVPALAGTKLLLAIVRADGPGVSRDCRPTIAGDRLTDFDFAYAAVEPEAILAQDSATEEPVTAALDAAVAAGVMALGAETVGLAAGLLEATVERVKSRQAFGAPLAAMQSVQLRTADMYLDLTAARAAVLELAGLLPNATPQQLRPVVAGTKITATSAALRIAAGAHQLCGGWGQLDEAGLHHFTRAIKAAEGQLGSPMMHRRAIAQLLAADPPSES